MNKRILGWVIIHGEENRYEFRKNKPIGIITSANDIKIKKCALVILDNYNHRKDIK